MQNWRAQLTEAEAEVENCGRELAQLPRRIPGRWSQDLENGERN